MKVFPKKVGLEKLRSIKDVFRDRIVREYEFKAKSCAACETPGACCLDAHFVNVHISGLEAIEIGDRLNGLPPQVLASVESRIEDAIENYNLSDKGDTFLRTYACPLFEPGIGCLVHEVKPVACIAHACYEREEDLPPDALLHEVELKIDRVNDLTFGTNHRWLPIPVALNRSK